MDHILDSRARCANESYFRGSAFERDLLSCSSAAYNVHFPPSVITCFIRLYVRVIRILPRPSNEGSLTRVLVAFGLKISRPHEDSPQRKARWVWAISRSSRLQNPLISCWSTKIPTFLVSAGEAICGVLKEDPGGEAVFSE